MFTYFAIGIFLAGLYLFFETKYIKAFEYEAGMAGAIAASFLLIWPLALPMAAFVVMIHIIAWIAEQLY